MMFHGWADPAIPATSSIGYYEMVTRTMGGLAATQAFARLFLFPGMSHCRAGGVNFADMLGALDAWVEGGKAPDQITAYAVADPNIGPTVAPAGFTGDNIAVARPKLSRPLFPYPDQPRYRSGDPDSAASFKRVRGPSAVK
jgi:feruloyl esterase